MNNPSQDFVDNTEVFLPAGAGSKRNRFGEPTKFLPIIFCLSTILLLYTIYVTFHCVPMLQFGVQSEHRDDSLRQFGTAQLVVFHVLTLLVVVCYIRSILASPGEVPDDDPQWEYVPHDSNTLAGGGLNVMLKETKRTGDRRHCKWCGKYKPDRCHHCRVCRTCVLKMDHHCPWIYNCVGFGNYKYFFLLLLYSVIDLHLIVWTMASSLQKSILIDTPIMTMFLLMFGETVASFMCLLLTSFFCFHIWLVAKAMTTIEFCEKSLPKPSKEGEPGLVTFGSTYDQGIFNNIAAVLGSNPLLMFLPLTPSPGDGMDYTNDRSRLAAGGKPHARAIARQQRRDSDGYSGYGAPDESLGGHYHGFNE